MIEDKIMNKELKRHIYILKTIPEIKKDIEELKFGCCIILYKDRNRV